MKKLESITITIGRDFRKSRTNGSVACAYVKHGVRACEPMALAEEDVAPILDAIVAKVKAHQESSGDTVEFAEMPADEFQ